MYTLHCTKKLLDRFKSAVVASLSPATASLGNWYAAALFWKPQVALLVNERTLLPALMPLACVSSRFSLALETIPTIAGVTMDTVAHPPRPYSRLRLLWSTWTVATELIARRGTCPRWEIGPGADNAQTRYL
jgi:hypothetical protein